MNIYISYISSIYASISEKTLDHDWSVCENIGREWASIQYAYICRVGIVNSDANFKMMRNVISCLKSVTFLFSFFFFLCCCFKLPANLATMFHFYFYVMELGCEFLLSRTIKCRYLIRNST